jgi:hypothetical protein
MRLFLLRQLNGRPLLCDDVGTWLKRVWVRDMAQASRSERREAIRELKGST